MLLGGDEYKSNTFTADTKKINPRCIKTDFNRSKKFWLNLITFADERQIWLPSCVSKILRFEFIFIPEMENFEFNRINVVFPSK